MPQFSVGDVVTLRKAHPCGSDRWEITRTGMDIGLKCLGCGRRVLLPRRKLERAVRSLTPVDPAEGPAGRGAVAAPPAQPEPAGRGTGRKGGGGRCL